MSENQPEFSYGENYVPTRWQQFLWWLATAEQELIRSCVIDRSWYAIVGMSVMATWLFATLAWSYFFYTVTASVLAALGLGIFMGGIILTIDRSLIKGLRRTGKGMWISLLFRSLLAVCIGLFMSQPALLYLFNKEIKAQVSIDNEARKRQKRVSQDSVYAPQRAILLTEKTALEQQLNGRYQEMGRARDNFIAETDGTGGSRKIGLKNIARVKEQAYQQLDSGYQQLSGTLQPRIKVIDSTLVAIDGQMSREQAAFESLLNDGFATRIEALNNLVKNNDAVAFRYYLLVVLLVLIELMPLLSKMMLPEGSYEEKIRLREAMEKTITRSNHEREQQQKEWFNQLSFELDQQMVKDFMEQSKPYRQSAMQDQLSAWQTAPGQSYKNLWQQFKKSLLSGQEP
jgi:hypothetical protein